MVLNTSAAVKNDFTFKEMLLQEDKAKFIKAMQLEVDDHEKQNHWTMMKREDIPSNHKTILAI